MRAAAPVPVARSGAPPPWGVSRWRGLSGRAAQPAAHRPVAAPRALALALASAPPQSRGAPGASAATTATAYEVNIPRGETAGAVLVVDGVTIQAGDRDLMDDVQWRVMPRQRVGLVGANGCGKSTLLRALTGQRGVDGGKLVLANGVALAYLEQKGVSGSTRSVWEEAKSRMSHVLDAEAAMEAASAAMEAGEASAVEALQQAQMAFEAAGGYDVDKRIATVLSGLGFRQDQFTTPCTALSGGWQMRVALARTLLSPAGESSRSGGDGLLILDEPTNHLDAAACRWLTSYLQDCSGSVVVISHDEAILETCTHITEVRGSKLHQFTGSYSEFIAMRKLREEQALSAAASANAAIARTESFMAKWGAKTAFASAAKSREKSLAKLKENLVDEPAAASAYGGGDATKASMRFLPPPPCHREMLKLKDAVVGWNGTPLFAPLQLTIEKGQRILVLGPNGAGKSSMLRCALAGSDPLLSGSRIVGEGVRMAVFAQDLAQELPLEMRALDYVLDKARKEDGTITLEQGRKSLGSLGLTGDSAYRVIGQLSGGEKARVALAAFALIPYNLLLLDEPSNHLDAGTIEALASALQDFTGCIVAITHNTLFAKAMQATHILRVQDGTVTLAPNLGDADLHLGAKPQAAGGSAQGRGSPAASAASRATSSVRRRSSEADEMEEMRAQLRAERFAAAGNLDALDEAESKPKSKNERLAAKKQAEAKAAADKIAQKKRAPKR